MHTWFVVLLIIDRCDEDATSWRFVMVNFFKDVLCYFEFNAFFNFQLLFLVNFSPGKMELFDVIWDFSLHFLLFVISRCLPGNPSLSIIDHRDEDATSWLFWWWIWGIVLYYSELSAFFNFRLLFIWIFKTRNEFQRNFRAGKMEFICDLSYSM